MDEERSDKWTNLGNKKDRQVDTGRKQKDIQMNKIWKHKDIQMNKMI